MSTTPDAVDAALEAHRQLAGLRFKVREQDETIEALRRENDRLRKVLRLVTAETERHRLAVEMAAREVR